MKKENSFFVDIRLGPTPDLVYEFGNGVNDIFLIAVNSNFPGSSWSNSAPAIQETNTQVSDCIKAFSTNNPFLIDRLKIYIPDGVDSPTTQVKEGLADISIFEGIGSGGYDFTRLPLVNAYKRDVDLDRYFEFDLNLPFDQFTAISFQTSDITGNWVDTTSIPLARIEVYFSKLAKRRKFYV